MKAASDELNELANILAKWLEPAIGVKAYLFGSRVRGDHRSDSDVDVRIFMEDWKPTEQCMQWWAEQNETDFAAVKAQLPGPLEIHRDSPDLADKNIRTGAKNPILVIGQLVVVWTPPKNKT
jgi:predicted nucleotidyltransferase